MTDNEIIRALECCANWEIDKICDGCPSNDGSSSCGYKLPEAALYLINRKNDEIERLEKEIESLNKQYPCTVKMSDYCLVYTRSLDDYNKLIDEIKSKTIKEFAERLKENIDDGELYVEDDDYFMTVIRIDNLVKEMTESED